MSGDERLRELERAGDWPGLLVEVIRRGLVDEAGLEACETAIGEARRTLYRGEAEAKRAELERQALESLKRLGAWANEVSAGPPQGFPGPRSEGWRRLGARLMGGRVAHLLLPVGPSGLWTVCSHGNRRREVGASCKLVLPTRSEICRRCLDRRDRRGGILRTAGRALWVRGFRAA